MIIDNGGESISLENICKQEDLEVFFKYTAPGTPQIMEKWKMCATLYNQVRSMSNGGSFHRH